MTRGRGGGGVQQSLKKFNIHASKIYPRGPVATAKASAAPLIELDRSSAMNEAILLNEMYFFEMSTVPPPPFSFNLDSVGERKGKKVPNWYF